MTENMAAGAAVMEGDDQQMELPPGFRFHPTDEELITHYLSKKALDTSFSAIAIGEVDMNKVEPWELPWKSRIGEKEWYFFSVRDKKYPTGLRTNRATASGYWKATGKDKEIFRGKCLVGMKKTLVFYQGRAPKGEKTNWVCHEYRLDGKFSAQSDWVISRVFHKSSGGKKDPFSGLSDNKNPVPPESGHVHCFSNLTTPVDDSKNQQEDIGCMMDFLNNPPSSAPSVFQWSQPVQNQSPFMNYASFPVQEPATTNLRSLLFASFKTEEEIICPSQDIKTEIGRSSFEAQQQQEAPSTSAGLQQELDCLWTY